MIALPLVVGSLHDTTTFDPLIAVVGADGVEGASAIRAPLPSDDSEDVPTIFVTGTSNHMYTNREQELIEHKDLNKFLLSI